MKKLFSSVLLVCLSLFAMVCIADTGAADVVDTSITEQIALALFSAFVSLPLTAQVIVMVVAFILVLVPHIAPLTPWTWDDKAIRYKDPIMQFFLRLWNVAAGNWGRATNKTPNSL